MKDDNMKLTRFSNLLAVGLALSFAAVGCKHTPVGVTPIPEGAKPYAGEPGPGPAIDNGSGIGGESMAIPETNPGKYAGWNENTEALQADSVYFDFDSAVVKNSEQSKVSAVADYLKANSSAAVRVEGNCDERGTEEYNRALGSRRALAVREELVSLGVDPSRVVTVSYGKDRPVDPGHDAAAWQKNRRDDFVVLTPP